MKPVKFKLSNAQLNAPEGWNEDDFGPCAALHILRANGCIYSCWNLSLWERIKIFLGHPVKLIIASSITMPPVALEVGEP